jgi:AraC family transcriptional regulator, transcriptional activator of pobA
MAEAPGTVRRKPDPKRKGARIPSFALYGEAPAPGQEMLHVEDIQSRSRLYHWEIGPHVHQGLYQILWLFRGEAEVALDEWRGAVEGPAAVVTPPGVVHGYAFTPGADGLVLTLSARFLVEGEAPSAAPAFRALFLAPGVVRFAPDDAGAPRLDAIIRELATEFAEPNGAASPVPLWLARAFVWRLAEAQALSGRALDLTGRRHQALFSRFLLMVEENFLERRPLEHYAKSLGLSTQRLNRLARAESGRSALEIVHERLTREACRRLHYVEAPADKLALELGFDDPSYFNRFFKRRTGMTPHRWRAACLQSSPASSSPFLRSSAVMTGVK